MIKRVLFSFALMMTVFACMGYANFPQYRLKFTVKTPFLLEKSAQFALPAGEYWVKDVGVASGHLLSLENHDHRHMAFLNTAPIDRAVVSYRDQGRVVFDLESETQLPVTKQFYIPGTDGYDILSAVYDKKGHFIDIATLSKTKLTITETQVTETTPAVTPETTEAAPEAAPVEQPDTTEAAPEAAPVEQPAPAIEEPRQNDVHSEPAPAPIRERQRVRKD